MALNFDKLRGRIVEKYKTQTAFAEQFGISKNSLSLKMNGITKFSTNDITKMVVMLDIPKEEIGTYFFTPKV